MMVAATAKILSNLTIHDRLVKEAVLAQARKSISNLMDELQRLQVFQGKPECFLTSRGRYEHARFRPTVVLLLDGH